MDPGLKAVVTLALHIGMVWFVRKYLETKVLDDWKLVNKVLTSKGLEEKKAPWSFRYRIRSTALIVLFSGYWIVNIVLQVYNKYFTEAT